MYLNPVGDRCNIIIFSAAIDVPSGWELVPSTFKMSKIVVSPADFVWALDNEDRAYVLIEDNWLFIGNEMYRSVAPSRSSIWVVQKNGNLLCRDGMTPRHRFGTHWLPVDGPSDIEKVVVGPGDEVFAKRNGGSLLVRLGITKQSPVGSKWHDTGINVKDVTVGSYGFYVVNMDDTISFASIKSINETSVMLTNWLRAATALKNITAGHGSSLWGLERDGTLVKRIGVEGSIPIGDYWQPFEGKTISVSAGLNKVYRVLADGKIVRKTGMLLYTVCLFAFFLLFVSFIFRFNSFISFFISSFVLSLISFFT